MMISEKDDLLVGIETARNTLRQLEAQNQELQRQTSSLDKDLLAERAVKEQKIKVEIGRDERFVLCCLSAEVLTHKNILCVHACVCVFLFPGLVICHEGGRRVDSPAPQAAAAVSADCPGAGATTQGAHTFVFF